MLHAPVVSAWPDPGDATAVIALGSDRSVHASTDPWIAAQVAFLRATHAAGIPVLGICFGGQALAAALGAAVSRAAETEIGWIDVDGHDDYGGRWFTWHEDVFDLPSGATELARATSGPRPSPSGQRRAAVPSRGDAGDRRRLARRRARRGARSRADPRRDRPYGGDGSRARLRAHGPHRGPLAALKLRHTSSKWPVERGWTTARPMHRACLAADSPPSQRSPRSRCARRPPRAPTTAPQRTSCRLPATSPPWARPPVPAQPAARRARPRRPGRERQAEQRLDRLLAADGRAGLRPPVAGRRHAGDRRPAPATSAATTLGSWARTSAGPGHARHRALDGQRVDGQPRPPRQPAQRRLHRGRPGAGPRHAGRPDVGRHLHHRLRAGAGAPAPTHARAKANSVRKKVTRRTSCARAASARRSGRSAKPRPSTACARAARARRR